MVVGGSWCVAWIIQGLMFTLKHDLQSRLALPDWL